MKSILLIFIGGGLGSVARFYLTKFIGLFHHHHFPFGTFVVNIVACLLLGFVVGFADHRMGLSASARLFWAVGFCGGFSTFSTFSSETLNLFQNGHNSATLLYILLSVLLCVSATFLGIFVAEKF